MSMSTDKQKSREALRMIKYAGDGREYLGTYETVAEFARATSVACGDWPDDVPDYIEENIDWYAVGERLLVQQHTFEVGKHGTHYFLFTYPKEEPMLALSRKEGESIVLYTSDGPVSIKIGYVRGLRAQILIDAPQQVRIAREELTHHADFTIPQSSAIAGLVQSDASQVSQPTQVN
jgi:sRNA-binding carbon storage regulator CsrA